MSVPATVVDAEGRLYSLALDNAQGSTDPCHRCAFVDKEDLCDNYYELCVSGNRGNFRLDTSRLALPVNYRKYPKLF